MGQGQRPGRAGRGVACRGTSFTNTASPAGSGHLGKGQSSGQPGAAGFAGWAAGFEGHNE